MGDRTNILNTWGNLEGREHLYNRNRSYDAVIGLKAIAYNLMIVSNVKAGEQPREIMKIVSC